MNNEFIENAKLTDEDLNQVAGGASTTLNWLVIQKRIPNVKPQSKILNELNMAISNRNEVMVRRLWVLAVEHYHNLGINLYKELGIIS